METELGLLRENFLDRGMLWLKSEHRVDAVVMAKEFAFTCGFNEDRVMEVSAIHFIQLISMRAFDSIRAQIDVVVLYEFERLSDVEAQSFRSALRAFYRYYVPSGLKIVLTSCVWITPSLGEFHDLPLISAHVKGKWGVDSMDSRIHRMIEQAARESNHSVKKISERAAVFLECVMASEKDEDIYSLISAGLGRFDGHVLRFRDLLPNLRPYFDESGESEEAT